jgi:hypothetical protein
VSETGSVDLGAASLAPHDVFTADDEGLRLEPPWPIFVRELSNGSIIPFLGAAASSYCMNQAGGAPPSGAGLGAYIAREAALDIACKEGCGRHLFDLSRLASYYQNCVSTRPKLDDLIRAQITNPHFVPNPLHYLLAEIAAIKPMLIITTNYDDLLERAFDAPRHGPNPVSYDVVVTPCDQLAYADDPDEGTQSCEPFFGPEHAGAVWVRRGSGNDCSDFEPILANTLTFDLKERSVIYKIHGSVSHGAGWPGGYLIAEEDYARFLGRMERGGIIPNAITNILRMKRRVQAGPSRSKSVPVYSMLFLGYSLSDWNLRVLLEELQLGRRAPGEEKHYAILRQQGLEARIAEQLLGRKSIQVYNCDLQMFVEQMEGHLKDHA